MAARVRLIIEGNHYCVLTYLNSDEDPHQRTYLSLVNENKALEQARQFGNERAESLGVTLEEKL